MNEPSTLGDGRFPPKVFYWRSRQRCDEWIKEHNPYRAHTMSHTLWVIEFHQDQIAGQYSWKRSNLHRVTVVLTVALIVFVGVSAAMNMVTPS